jgi:hypothetical protein
MTIAENFREELSNRNGVLLEGEASGELLTIQVHESQAPYEYHTILAFDIDDLSTVIAQLLDATVGTPTKRGLLCDFEISQEDGSLRFEVSVEWPDLTGPLLFTFADSSQMEFHNPGEVVTRAPRRVTSWEELCDTNRVQMVIESVIHSVERSELRTLLDKDETINLDAVLAALTHLVRAERPDQGIVRESVRWIASKLNLFVDGFASAAGKTAGAAAVTLSLCLAGKHVSELHHWIAELTSMTES